MLLADMLEPIDRDKITNFGNLTPAFQDSEFDPGRKHSMPYMWGTQGIGYRKSKVSSPPDSWKVLFDSDEYSGKIALLSEGVLGAALMYLGHSYNSTVPGTKSRRPRICSFARSPTSRSLPRTTVRTCCCRARSI